MLVCICACVRGGLGGREIIDFPPPPHPPPPRGIPSKIPRLEYLKNPPGYYKSYINAYKRDKYAVINTVRLLLVSWLASGRVSTRPERMCVFPLRPGLLSEKTA